MEGKSMNWQTTLNLIPDGVQTMSKMPSKHVEGVYPLYLDRGDGAYVYDSSGKAYIDYTCSLGTILLGHNVPEINRAVMERMQQGVLFGLPHQLETELAEKINNLIPSAEMMRFLKTGSEACQAAIRIARAVTGREKIIVCGYFGWHEWFNWTTPDNKGCMPQQTVKATYNDIDSFTRYFEGDNAAILDIPAAVIIEPYIYDEPKDNFLTKLRNLCNDYHALLIFDEIVTGFRTLDYSAQAHFGVKPDLTCLGKALGNGLPIAVIAGKKEYMKVLQDGCFVSSTWGGELIGIVAALKVLEIIEKEGIIEHIWRMGDQFINEFRRIAEGLEGVGIRGYPCRTFFDFPTEAHKSLFWQECLLRGVFFGYAQFINFAHKQQEIDRTVDVMNQAMKMVKSYWEEPEKGLKGKVAQATLRLITTQ